MKARWPKGACFAYAWEERASPTGATFLPSSASTTARTFSRSCSRAHLYAIDRAVIEETIRNFKGLPHRVEFVRGNRGRQVLQRLQGDERRRDQARLEEHGREYRACGRRKGQRRKLWIRHLLADRIRGLVLIGEAAERNRDRDWDLTCRLPRGGPRSGGRARIPHCPDGRHGTLLPHVLQL